MSDLLKRLRGYNPPDRTVDEQRQIAQDIHDAADEIERLTAYAEELERRPRVYPQEDGVVVTLADGASALFLSSCDIAQEIVRRLSENGVGNDSQLCRAGECRRGGRCVDPLDCVHAPEPSLRDFEHAVSPLKSGTQIPGGWKLVPVEPDEEMLRAVTGAVIITPQDREDFRRTWEIALAAAPECENTQGDSSR